VTRHHAAFVCAQCGRREARWLGHCPACGAWDSFAEERAAPGRAVKTTCVREDGAGGRAAGPVLLSEVVSSAVDRFSTGIAELDLVLGGGVVPGSLVLVGGEPGIGKSTLLLQVLDHVAASGRPVLLVCGEESPSQVKLRAERVCADPGRIQVFSGTDLDDILTLATEASPALLVVDSIQTVSTSTAGGQPGSIGQVRDAAGAFLRFAKDTGTAVVLVGHVTKEGGIAGPRVLEHVVDTVLQFEGDRSHYFRLLRATKNRFGSTDELGVFQMGGEGLSGVADPSHAFLRDELPTPGAAVHVAVEGSRCFLVEVEALVSHSEVALPRRVAVGYDRNRLAMLVAVLGRHAGSALSTADVFVSIAGGIRIDEPAADLAVALAIVSAERGVSLPSRVAVFGEISLTGQLRPCSQSARRAAEAERAGFVCTLVPAADASRTRAAVQGAATLKEAITTLLCGSTLRPRVADASDGGE
jgi:DNA repair protein RadA/Sms